MNTSRAFKSFVVALLLSALAGCKLLVIVPPGGVVNFSEGTDCNPDDGQTILETGNSVGTICVIDVNDSTFSRSFTAVPQDGFEFRGWREGKGFQCGGSQSATCAIVFDGGAVASFLADSQGTGFIMPIFKDVGIDTDEDGMPDRKDEDDDNDGVADVEDDCPLVGPNMSGFGCPVITDTIIRVAKVWAQADIFNDLSWADMNAACPGGVCSDRALLRGYDMSGWRWATAAEVQVLMNSYWPAIPVEFSGPFGLTDEYFWALSFFDGGWRPNLFDFASNSDAEQATEGLVSDPLDAHTGEPWKVGIACFDCATTVVSSYSSGRPFGWRSTTHIESMGGYFYRAN